MRHRGLFLLTYDGGGGMVGCFFVSVFGDHPAQRYVPAGGNNRRVGEGTGEGGGSDGA